MIIILMLFKMCLNKYSAWGSNASESFNPGNAAAKAIADKLMRARQRVAAQGRQKIKGSSCISILTVGSFNVFERSNRLNSLSVI